MLSNSIRMLVEGLTIVKFNLLDLTGEGVWSSDSQTLGISKRESPLYQKALTMEVSSNLVKDHELVNLDGENQRLDVVETYLR